MDAYELLRRADAALYCAKDRGRHCFQVFSSGLDEKESDEMTIAPKT
jgi:predicted signal transduction protein with EAL and GGDEF domain